VVRGSAPGDRFGADEPAESFAEAAGREPGRLRIAWSVRSPVRGVSPAREHVQAVQDIAALLADLGHDVVEVDPAYPDVTTAFVPQFLGGVRAEAAVVEHPERLERRTREALLLGRWATPRVVERAMRHGDRLAARVDAVFAEHDLLLTPTTAHRPPRVGVLDGAGVVRAALRSLPAIAYTALWNVTGHPAASVPAGTAEDGLPLAVQLVGRTAGEPTILSVAAQLERARPWAHRWPEAATG
jgi:amidase